MAIEMTVSTDATVVVALEEPATSREILRLIDEIGRLVRRDDVDHVVVTAHSQTARHLEYLVEVLDDHARHFGSTVDLEALPSGNRLLRRRTVAA